MAVVHGLDALGTSLSLTLRAAYLRHIGYPANLSGFHDRMKEALNQNENCKPWLDRIGQLN